ncbi:hypothetical protein NE619_10500 [Anaerovorax odorimutans]|uniref:Uncharacterized protein n=1 Tax=Anaerovorax odorimutans TaxID=109327 RepID=A0ABT1RPR2_9FIRM|nr:hypothetical protein [Anaerovorax odorimutans]MCQ4637156.1 hypothetical protein [Anaerovorax odorimutans]
MSSGIEKLNMILQAALGCIKKVDSFLQVRTVQGNTMSLTAGYDGVTYGTAPTISGYKPLMATIRGAGATDICWIDCFFTSEYTIQMRLKNTTTTARNNFTPTVIVLYIKVT